MEKQYVLSAFLFFAGVASARWKVLFFLSYLFSTYLVSYVKVRLYILIFMDFILILCSHS